MTGENKPQETNQQDNKLALGFVILFMCFFSYLVIFSHLLDYRNSLSSVLREYSLFTLVVVVLTLLSTKIVLRELTHSTKPPVVLMVLEVLAVIGLFLLGGWINETRPDRLMLKANDAAFNGLNPEKTLTYGQKLTLQYRKTDEYNSTMAYYNSVNFYDEFTKTQDPSVLGYAIQSSEKINELYYTDEELNKIQSLREKIQENYQVYDEYAKEKQRIEAEKEASFLAQLKEKLPYVGLDKKYLNATKLGRAYYSSEETIRYSGEKVSVSKYVYKNSDDYPWYYVYVKGGEIIETRDAGYATLSKASTSKSKKKYSNSHLTIDEFDLDDWYFSEYGDDYDDW